MQVLYSNALPQRLCFFGGIIFKLLLKTNRKELDDGLFNKLGVDRLIIAIEVDDEFYNSYLFKKLKY